MNIRFKNILYIFWHFPKRSVRILKHIGNFFNVNSKKEWFTEVHFYLLDLLGIPEIYEILNDIFKHHSRKLNVDELAYAQEIFAKSIDYQRIRIDEKAYFGTKKYNIIYVSFYTINVWGVLPIAVLMHELVHIWQYEHLGAVYIPRALRAQRTAEGYNYGGIEALRKAKSLSDFNYEQQADIIEDYCLLKQGECPQWGDATIKDLAIYEKFIKELSKE